jgi:poly(3-hydroxyalkanoate) synthetase
LRLVALPWGISLESITAPVDVWHGRDDTIVKIEQVEILAAAIPGAHRYFLADHGHFSLVYTQAASYLQPLPHRSVCLTHSCPVSDAPT